MSFSDYWENNILDHVTGNNSYTAPTAIWAALSKADPLDDNSGLDEPNSTAGYARVETSAGYWNTASGGVVTNSAKITFPEATSAQGTVSDFALLDQSSGGNQLAHGALDTSKTIASGDTPEFGLGDLSIKLD